MLKKSFFILSILIMSMPSFGQNDLRDGDCYCWQDPVFEQGDVEVIEVEPAKIITSIIPAVYENIIAKKMVKPSHTVLSDACGCFEEIPAEYVEYSYKLLKQPERTEVTVIPAVTKEIKTLYLKNKGRTIITSIGECKKVINQ